VPIQPFYAPKYQPRVDMTQIAQGIGQAYMDVANSRIAAAESVSDAFIEKKKEARHAKLAEEIKIRAEMRAFEVQKKRDIRLHQYDLQIAQAKFTAKNNEGTAAALLKKEEAIAEEKRKQLKAITEQNTYRRAAQAVVDRLLGSPGAVKETTAPRASSSVAGEFELSASSLGAQAQNPALDPLYQRFLGAGQKPAFESRTLQVPYESLVSQAEQLVQGGGIPADRAELDKAIRAALQGRAKPGERIFTSEEERRSAEQQDLDRMLEVSGGTPDVGISGSERAPTQTTERVRGLLEQAMQQPPSKSVPLAGSLFSALGQPFVAELQQAINRPVKEDEIARDLRISATLVDGQPKVLVEPVRGGARSMVLAERAQGVINRQPGFFDQVLIDLYFGGASLQKSERDALLAEFRGSPEIYQRLIRGVIPAAGRPVETGAAAGQRHINKILEEK